MCSQHNLYSDCKYNQIPELCFILVNKSL
uniref:Uncharacterized protein n=1 Tax=Anguilla anguilla TaxID=7936 RepID=A0A0E9QTB2_ANGAN